MNQILRRYAPYGAAVLVAAGVVTVGLMQGPTTPLARPLLVSLKQTSSAYLSRQAQPPLAAPSGATSSLHCPFNDLSGSLQCTNQAGTYYELAKNGAPVYQLRTPIPVLGQGRKGWNFAAGSSERVCASDNATHSMGESSFTVEAVVTPRNISASSEVFVGGPLDTHNDNTGWSFYTTGSGRVVINIRKQLVNFYCQTAVGTLESNKTYRVTATATYAAGAWSSFTTYVNGQSVACTTGGAGVAGAIDNSFPVCVGASHNTAGYNHHFTGEIHELIIRRGVVDDAATVLARYRAQLATGAYTSTDGSTQGLYRFSETAATSLVDYSGGNNHLTAVNGTPDVQYGAPPYPMGSGLTKRSIYSADGATSYFLASDTAAGDLATSNFSITLLVKPDANNTNGEVWISKRKDATLKGFELGRDTAANGRQIKFLLGDGSGFTSGWVSGVGPLNPGTWNCITLNATRASTATAIVNRAPTGVTLDISARQLSISSDRGLYVFRSGEAGLPASTTSIAGFLIADKVMTVDEHTAACAKWMKPPSTVASFTRNSSACHSHGSEPGFGERIGCYGPGQWPMGYKAASVSNPRGNPAGWAFPHRSTVVNMLGRANEFGSWTTGGVASVASDVSEGPDGSMTADRLTHNATGYIYKAPVGGGLHVAGDTPCVQAYARKVAGNCTHICSGTWGAAPADYNPVPLIAGQWVPGWQCRTLVGATKRFYLYGGTSDCIQTDCVVDLAEGQWEDGYKKSDRCTKTPGDVTQTCNFPLVTGSWENKANILKWSEVFNATGAWTTAFASVASTAVVLPNGQTGYANTFHEDATAATTHYLEQTFTTVPDRDHCLSLYAKPANRSWVLLGQPTLPDGLSCYFDIQNGVVGTCNLAVSATISSAGGGWYRLTIPWRTTGLGVATYRIWGASGDGGAVFNGLNQDSVYIWGASVSPGSCPGSYAKTTTEVLAGNNLMPSSLYRGEVEVQATMVPYVSTPGYRRVLVASGDDRVLLTEGQIPTFVWSGQGGSMEAVARGKPITYQDVSRKYTISWNNEPSEGLTNTNPRRYAALSIDGAYQRTTLSPRTRDAVDVQSQRDLGSTTFYIGGDASGNSCNCDIESWELYGRPAQVARSTQADHIITLDMTGAGYLQNAATPDLCDYSFGVASANRWCWPMTEFSGSLYDKHNGVALAPSGTPSYQVPSGLLARGQGRRLVNLSDSARVSAPNTGVAAITGTTWAIESLISIPSGGVLKEQEDLLTTTAQAYDVADNGYGLWASSGGRVSCQIAGNTTGRVYTGNNVLQADSKVRHVGCVFKYVAGAWTIEGPYVDGVVVASTPSGTLPTSAAITNAVALHSGRLAAADPFHLHILESRVSSTAFSAAQMLDHYKQSTQTGKHWTYDANSLGHYKFTEAALTNGVGVRDHSGNGNHLTVVSGTPTPSYRAAPWPMGSGVVRPAVDMPSNLVGFLAADGTPASPSATGAFSVAAWVRSYTTSAGIQRVVMKNFGLGDYYYLFLSSGTPTWRWYTTEGGLAVATAAADLRDGRWHLLAARATYAAGTWTTAISLDGAAFVNGSTTTGDPSTNTGVLQVGLVDSDVGGEQLAGVAFWKDYALTNADVLALRGATDPTGGLLTYARTSTSAKGICYDVANDPVDGIRVRCFRDNEIPYHWRSDHTTLPGNETMGLGLPRHAAITNSTQNSEDVSAATWTRTFVTATTNSTIAPDGTLTADTLAETVNANFHFWNANQTTALAQNDTFATSVYLKKAANTNWINVRGYENGGSYIYANVRLDTLTIGNSGANGADVTSQASNLYGAANGWIRVVLKGTCVKVAGCSVRTYAAFTNNTDPAAGALVNYAGAIANTVHTWGGQTSAPAAAAESYCPTPGSASATCNAPTSLYVPAANLASWTRAQGVTSFVGFPGNALVAYDLANGSTTVGEHRTYMALAGANIYDSAGVLSQGFNGPQQTAATLRGALLVWDSAADFYGTRSSYSMAFDSSYAGQATSWATDVGAWTPAAATNLHLGAYYTTENPINGDMLLLSIHGTR